MKQSRIATRRETEALAKRIKTKAGKGQREGADKFARESQERLNAFCKRFK